jgi:hypothetical protein
MNGSAEETKLITYEKREPLVGEVIRLSKLMEGYIRDGKWDAWSDSRRLLEDAAFRLADWKP